MTDKDFKTIRLTLLKMVVMCEDRLSILNEEVFAYDNDDWQEQVGHFKSLKKEAEKRIKLLETMKG